MSENYTDKSLDFRRDFRTVEQFKQDIKFRTEKEKFLVELYKKEMALRGHKVVIENNGVDNEGELLKKSNCEADYKISIDNGEPFLVDVKNSYLDSKWTFKTHSLKQYVKSDTSILIFWATGRLDGNHINLDRSSTCYGIISPSNISKILKTYEHYKEYTFGNKMCVRIPKVDFSKWLTIHKLKES